jgi:hypothetical protein
VSALPKAVLRPKDGETVYFFHVQDDGEIKVRRAVWHVNDSWAKVMPHDTDRPGAPFTKQWSLWNLINESSDKPYWCLTGRTADGEAASLHRILEAQRGAREAGSYRFFFEWADARAEAIKRAKGNVECLNERLSEAEEKLEAAQALPETWEPPAT